MSNRPPEPPGGVPPSIAAIMAAIRDEVTATGPRAAPPPASASPPVAPPPAAAEPPPAGTPSRGGSAPRLPATLDAEVRALLAPMLRDWFDAHLPEIVEAATRAEIRRLTVLNE